MHEGSVRLLRAVLEVSALRHTGHLLDVATKLTHPLELSIAARFDIRSTCQDTFTLITPGRLAERVFGRRGYVEGHSEYVGIDGSSDFLILF